MWVPSTQEKRVLRTAGEHRKRPVGYKTKTEYGNAVMSSGPGIEFALCTLGGEQFGGKEDAPE